MFKNFLAALLEKITHHLIKHVDFFEHKSAWRKENLEHISIPATFKKYLEDLDESDFLKDVLLISNFIHSPKTTEIKDNTFFKTLLEFLNIELGRKIDQLDGEYYLMDQQGRKEVIEKLLPGESHLAKSLREILENQTYQQLTSEINNLGYKVAQASYIVVQSPREIENKLKREIRAQLLEKCPYSFPTFQINRKLIGGIRIFKNGTTIDHSWLSRVLRFTSLTSV